MSGGDWIDWNGGECPVGRDAWVEVRLRDGGSLPAQSAKWYDWRHNAPEEEPGYDIVAYRVLNP